jgi:hypothetical protein
MDTTDFQPLFTNRIRALIEEAENLDITKPIEFRVMEDPNDLDQTLGGLVRHEKDADIIFLDPRRVDEYIVAHELMHAILRRDGWPQIITALPTGYDPFGSRLAKTLDNVLDQSIFDFRLQELGFDLSVHREQYFSILEGWPEEDSEGQGLLFNAFKLFEGMLAGDKHRRKIIELMHDKQPGTLHLAQQIFAKSGQIRSRKKPGVRKAAISILNFIEKYITNISGESPNLPQRISVSPVFRREHLGRIAAIMLNLEQHNIQLEGQKLLYLCGVYLKSANGLITNYIYEGDRLPESHEITELKEELQSVTLSEFITEKGILYGIYP